MADGGGAPAASTDPGRAVHFAEDPSDVNKDEGQWVDLGQIGGRMTLALPSVTSHLYFPLCSGSKGG